MGGIPRRTRRRGISGIQCGDGIWHSRQRQAQERSCAFLNFLQSEEARQIAVNNGYPPIGEGDAPSTDNQLLAQVLSSYESLVKSGNTTDYINNATAGIQASAIIPGFQSLLDGTMTPQQFVDSIQKQYAKETK